MLTLSEVKQVTGDAGNFEVNLIQHPRYIDESKCIACGMCAEKCPKKVVDVYNTGLVNRKAVYVEYAQAVPLKYCIDAENCLYLTKGKCGNCENICPAGAIDYTQKEKSLTLNVGSIVLAPGFKSFDPSKLDFYNYASHKNVVTAAEFERILSASGPTMGHLARISDKKEPKKIAWFQCVGSRDVNKCDNAYCSSVCCMYAIKEAAIAKEHAGDDLDCAIFYMDIRTHGKDFERYYNDAKDKTGVRFINSRVHSVLPIHGSDDLEVRYVDESGKLISEIFDMIVLSTGFETPPEVVELLNDLDVDLTEGNFAKTSAFNPVATSRDGIYICGAIAGPRDIPQSVVDSSAAASDAGEILSSARNSLTTVKEAIPETQVVGDPPKIGVFVCKCGINIAGVVDVEAVRDYAATLPYVEYVCDNLYTCSQDTQDIMADVIKSKNLNRVVVAACTPKTHEPLFQETLLCSGLNKYLFEMANIRNQDSWVHKNNPELATKKAMDLVRMAVSKVALMEPLEEAELEINQEALVIGGGISGLTSSISLAGQGYNVNLVEKSDVLGGQALNIYKTASGEYVQENLSALIKKVESNEKIKVYLKTEIVSTEGFVGNFKSVLSTGGEEKSIEYGVSIVATGASALEPDEYNYKTDERVLTSLELDRKFIDKDPELSKINSAAFIQCVGSREPGRPYCSRVCCTHSIENALELKKLNPEMNIYILYRDIRTFGEREYLYKEARNKGIIFIKYKLDNKPEVVNKDGRLIINIVDHVLRQPVEIEVDLITLATAILPPDNQQLASFYKVSVNDDGFFVEKHAKLGPSEFATDGVFLCGLAHYPKPIEEAIAQGKAAASRAVTLLAKKKINTIGTIAKINPMNCSSCGVCISICPYSAPSYIEEGPFTGKVKINPVLCKGCGLCVASCRSGAINLKGFDNDQIFAQIYALKEAV